jgi:NAD(P)-dependent dehydrogenase (short-subunit alcohol dehydrogenase family)
MEPSGLTGKRVLVTAAATGIGRRVAERFADGGARPQCGAGPAGALEAFGVTHPAISATLADVAYPSDIEQIFANVRAGLGGLDILVNNAGVSGPAAPVEEMDDGSWRRTLDVNLTGAFLCTKFAVPMIKEAGGGSIVFMSSNAGTMGLPFRGPYVASKWGLIGFTKSMAMELGSHNIRVNAICPGDVEGERIDRVIAAEARNRGISADDVIAERVAAVSLHTMVSADDVAALILFVCSEAGAKISGQALVVDGNAERA